MKLKLVAVMLLSMPVVSLAMEKFTMPTADILQKRLSEAGFDHFIEKTTIIKQLAGREIVALGVAMIIETSLYDYNEYNLKGMPEEMARTMQTLMQMRKPQLFESLLQDHPAALAELQKLNI